MADKAEPMSDTDVVRNIIRAWKDDEYRQSLPADVQKLLPDNPAGFINLVEAELESNPTRMLPSTYATRCSEGWRCLSVTKC